MLYKRKINANKYMELYEEYAREKLWDHLEQLDAKDAEGPSKSVFAETGWWSASLLEGPLLSVRGAVRG